MVRSIGLASGIGAGNSGCGKGPEYFQKHLKIDGETINWQEMILATSDFDDKYDSLSYLNKKYAQAAYTMATNEPFFFAFGGDHSCALGLWSGVAEAKRKDGDIGLIWIDAHMDSHTPQTSESGNIHGMPVAALLGHGDKRFTDILSANPKIKPENIFLIGVRSYEAGEADFLKRMNVRVYHMDEVRQRGLAEILKEVLTALSKRTVGYGLSFDLDAIDPSFVTAVGTPESGGIDAESAIESMKLLAEFPPIAFEIVEYNPELDIEGATFEFTKKLINSVMQSVGATK